MASRILNIAVVVSLNKDYDRKVAKGIATYARSNPQWRVYLEDDVRFQLPELGNWKGDGLIANLDTPEFNRKLDGLSVPIVGVGGATSIEYLRESPTAYVASDSPAVAKLAAQHLIDLGLQHFAFYGIESSLSDPSTAWSIARDVAFESAVGPRSQSFDRLQIRPEQVQSWSNLQNQLATWLRSLPKPIGILACNDSHARHLVLACGLANIAIPAEVAVIGVDNDELMCEMIVPSISSIDQAPEKIGYLAAKLLDELLSKKRPRTSETEFVYCEPVGVFSRASTDALFVRDPIVVACLTYIRENMQKGLNVQSLSKFAGYSRSMLDIRFEQATGFTAAQTIRRIQLDNAKKLLTQTSVPLKQIAQQIGLASDEHFSSWFRRITGKTPSDYRTENQMGSVAWPHP